MVERIEVEGVDVAYLAAGDASAPMAVLLHGFPDSARTWAAQIDPLVAAGFRVAAPWLRGYAPTAVPADRRFQGGAFVADVLGLHDRLGGDERAVLIGHDIGAVVAYGAAAAEPDRWSRVVTLAVPPTAELAAGLSTYEQLRRSWYTFLFQHPAADALLTVSGFLEGLVSEWSPDWTDGSQVVDDARMSLPDPANVTAALGYYRATFDPTTWDPGLQPLQDALAYPVQQPWLYLHGERDGCVGAEVAALVPGAVIVPEAGHFLHRERPDVVNDAIIGFLTA